MSLWSVATYTSRAPLSRARSATRTTMGLPPISASAFPGNRLDANRAGIMAVKDMWRILGGASRSLVHFFLGGQLSRLFLEHHRNIVPNRKREAVGLADEYRLCT